MKFESASPPDFVIPKHMVKTVIMDYGILYLASIVILQTAYDINTNPTLIHPL